MAVRTATSPLEGTQRLLAQLQRNNRRKLRKLEPIGVFLLIKSILYAIKILFPHADLLQSKDIATPEPGQVPYVLPATISRIDAD